MELFDGGWLVLGENISHVRVMVARHAAPASGKHIPVGKRVGEWVYELFITRLWAEGFLVEDVLDLYQGRGAFEAVLADEDVEEDPDRWCSSSECGQELWQIACPLKSRPEMPHRAAILSMLTTWQLRMAARRSLLARTR